MKNDENKTKPTTSSEIQLDKFLREIETEEGAKKWGKEASNTAKQGAKNTKPSK